MKNLSSYIDEKINALFTKYNAFFAFSEEQFEKQKKENIIAQIYQVNIGMN